jgi:hypothetical protein
LVRNRKVDLSDHISLEIVGSIGDLEVPEYAIDPESPPDRPRLHHVQLKSIQADRAYTMVQPKSGSESLGWTTADIMQAKPEIPAEGEKEAKKAAGWKSMNTGTKSRQESDDDGD